MSTMYLEILLATALTLVSLKLYVKLTTGICKSPVCLIGKTALVTGANAGIGYETALDFAKRGARVILACRDENRARQACNQIIKETNNSNVVYRLVDFASFDSVKKFANKVKDTEEHLDILVNNAGAAVLGDKITEDDLPIVMQINYFSHFLLTNLLLDLLKKKPSRIVNVSSFLATFGIIDLKNLTTFKGNNSQYCCSKLCQILFTMELARRLQTANVTSYSLHPGLITTGIYRHCEKRLTRLYLLFLEVFYKNPLEGAQTQIYCALENGLEQYSGEYFKDCKLVSGYINTKNQELAKALWKKSEEIVGLRCCSE